MPASTPIDQGYDTMEGASGDDWISGTQSMRDIFVARRLQASWASFSRAKGFPGASANQCRQRCTSYPADFVGWSRGELSRIGELVLNPFVGP